VGSEKRPEESAVVGQLEMEELVDDDLASELFGLVKKSYIKTHTTTRRTAGPLALHPDEMDFRWFNLQVPSP
jgi:hypothetical protein